MNDDFLSKIVSSSNRRPSGPKNQKKPIKGEMILQMLRLSNLDCLVELRNCLIIIFAFCLLLRHDELSHVALNHIDETEDGYKILIPKSKTDKFRNGSHVFLKKSSNDLSVSSLFERYLNLVDLKIGSNHFLFFPLKKNGSSFSKANKILSYATYRDTVKQLIEKIGHDPKDYGTHSMRSGGATELASDISEFELLTTGRWSDARSIRSYVEMSDSARFDISRTLQSTITDGQGKSSHSHVMSSDTNRGPSRTGSSHLTNNA